MRVNLTHLRFFGDLSHAQRFALILSTAQRFIQNDAGLRCAEWQTGGEIFGNLKFREPTMAG